MSTGREDSKGHRRSPIANNGSPIDQESNDGNGVVIDQPSPDGNGAAREMDSYGVVRNDTIWVTECAWCKRTRNTAGDWFTLNPIVRAAMSVERTHGICPTCARAAVARADETNDGSTQ